MPTRAFLYSKPDCHLCDLASDILDQLASDGSLLWTRVDIKNDPALFERFRYEIPVIELDNGTLLKWPTTLERVRRALGAVERAG